MTKKFKIFIIPYSVGLVITAIGLFLFGHGAITSIPVIIGTFVSMVILEE